MVQLKNFDASSKILLGLFLCCFPVFVFAESMGTPSQKAEESSAADMSWKLWMREHHGVIFYQDETSDTYDFEKLVSLAKDLGMEVVKTWIKGGAPGEIPDKAKSAAYKSIFDSFQTVALNVCPDYILARWDQGRRYDAQTRQDVRSDFYRLTKSLLGSSAHRGKTFIISYFFEVNVYMGTEPSGRPDFPVLEFIADAQAGVKAALGESRSGNIRILDCLEANCDHDVFRFVKDIFPKVAVDLYSVSFYGEGPLKSKLDYWAKNAPDNSLFANKNIMVGEYGIKMEDGRVGGSEKAQSAYLRSVEDEARAWGAPYIFLFWLADQDSKVRSEGCFGLVDMQGHKRQSWKDLYSAYH